MLTAKDQEQDIVMGLNLGADDYVTKPFSIKQLLGPGRGTSRRTGSRSRIFINSAISSWTSQNKS